MARTVVFGLLGLDSLPFIATQLLAGYVIVGALYDQAARRTTLEAPRTLQGITMPSGTRLTLRDPDRPASFESARFPKPVSVYGFETARLTRHLAPAPGDAVLSLADDQDWNGWRCRAGQPLNVTLNDDGRRAAIRSCVLTASQTLGETLLPAGSALRTSSGARYVDGRRGADRWIVRPPQNSSIPVAGAHLKAVLRLDSQRHLLSARGALTAPLSLGTMHYPSGTAIRLSFDGQTGAPSAWLLSPGRGQTARRDDGPDVEFGVAVAHHSNGDVEQRLSNREAGFYHIRPLR
ncbi:hypothetical protein V5738_09650 [Salinisphaera sp. SPP-AMP-43]|uniref:hypothetical protein n=1 Tax=Salinisphaera sp. SPP-AMP-43 TaxID=3121288 RepID=UPI003C6E908F